MLADRGLRGAGRNARGAEPERAEPGRAELRLRVDWILCDGYGLCGDLLPDLIGLDDWRYPVLPRGPIDPGRRHDVQRAVDCCPMKALLLESVRPDARR